MASTSVRSGLQLSREKKRSLGVLDSVGSTLLTPGMLCAVMPAQVCVQRPSCSDWKGQLAVRIFHIRPWVFWFSLDRISYIWKAGSEFAVVEAVLELLILIPVPSKYWDYR